LSRRRRHAASTPAVDATARDEDLVAAAQAGSHDAFAQLVERYQPAILRYLLRRTNDTELAADLLQETFLDAWQCLGAVRDGAGFSRWLYRIAHNNLLPEWRRRPCSSIDQVEDERGVVPTPLHLPDDTAACHERVVIERALERLGETARTALAYSLQGYTSDEVADVLGIEPEAARKRIGRAKRRFRDEYLAA
jgi:RNA polymerase sigma-70 factor (ECF subfamily)